MPAIDLADGRRLAYEEHGDPAGTPVLFQHGTGDSRLARHPDEALTASLGVRLVTVDRPGVGGSDRRPGRTLLDWAGDLGALADALGIERFAAAGWSGGGPHALAAAARLGERVSSVALACPLGPFDRPGARRLVTNRELQMIWRLRHVRPLAHLIARFETARVLRDVGGLVDGLIEDTPADGPVLGDPVLRPMFEAEMREALAQRSAGVLDDMWAFLDWGFAPEEVAQPVVLFHGDRDGILRPEMAESLAARLPDCRAVTWEGAGHYAVFARWEEFLRAAAV